MINKLRLFLFSFLQLDSLLIQISLLKKENEELKAKVDEHDKAVASIAVLQVKVIKDLLTLSNIQSSNMKFKFHGKKVDDDMLN